MILVLSFAVDAEVSEEYSLNDTQKRLLREFEEASDKPLSGAEWFTTSEETFDKMMNI